jgi:hypothetical protein
MARVEAIKQMGLPQDVRTGRGKGLNDKQLKTVMGNARATQKNLEYLKQRGSINELSNKTLASYIKKAAADLYETYRALQEAELLKGKAAAARQAELAKQGNPNAMKAILRKEKVGTMTVPKDRNRKPNEGLSNYSFEKMLQRLASPGFANPSVTQLKAADHKKQAQEKKDKLQAQDGFRTRESVVREITAELAAAKPKIRKKRIENI